MDASLDVFFHRKMPVGNPSPRLKDICECITLGFFYRNVHDITIVCRECTSYTCCWQVMVNGRHIHDKEGLKWTPLAMGIRRMPRNRSVLVAESVMIIPFRIFLGYGSNVDPWLTIGRWVRDQFGAGEESVAHS